MSQFFHYSHIHENHFAKNAEVVLYKKNQYLVWRSDESPWVFFLKEGLVKASFSFPDGNDRLIGYFLPGTTFAQSGSFFQDSGGKLEYTAETNSTVYRIKRETFLEQLSQNPELCQEYLKMTLKNQIFLIDRIIYQSEKNILTKLARWILFMDKYYGSDIGNNREIQIPLTQSTIANFLHATRESINTTLQKFVKQKYIHIVNKKIIILDKEGLESILKY